MKHIHKWFVIAALVFAGLQFTACQNHNGTHHAEHPAEVEEIPGSDLKKVTLTEKAVQRIDVRTDKVREQQGKKVVPYSSLIYDPQGQTWVYIETGPRSYMRHKVEVDYIDGDTVVLKEGPSAGTVIASVAVAELYGTEFGVGH
jgi:hypothetical protein